MTIYFYFHLFHLVSLHILSKTFDKFKDHLWFDTHETIEEAEQIHSNNCLGNLKAGRTQKNIAVKCLEFIFSSRKLKSKKSSLALEELQLQQHNIQQRPYIEIYSVRDKK